MARRGTPTSTERRRTFYKLGRTRARSEWFELLRDARDRRVEILAESRERNEIPDSDLSIERVMLRPLSKHSLALALLNREGFIQEVALVVPRLDELEQETKGKRP